MGLVFLPKRARWTPKCQRYQKVWSPSSSDRITRCLGIPYDRTFFECDCQNQHYRRLLRTSQFELFFNVLQVVFTNAQPSGVCRRSEWFSDFFVLPSDIGCCIALAAVLTKFCTASKFTTVEEHEAFVFADINQDQIRVRRKVPFILTDLHIYLKKSPSVKHL